MADEAKKDEVIDEPTEKQEETVSVKEMQRRIATEKARVEAAKEAELEALKQQYEEEKKKAKMSKEEKTSYELKKKEQEIEDYKNQLKRFELTKEATKVLAEKDLTISDELLDFVVRDGKDSTLQAIDLFAELVEKNVNQRIKENVRQSTPRDGQSSPNASVNIDKAKMAAENRII